MHPISIFYSNRDITSAQVAWPRVHQVGCSSVRDVTEEWLEMYNTERPQCSLGGVPPSLNHLGPNH